MESNITIEKIIELVNEYDKESISIIEKAYLYALKIHGNQRRKSGELYINHPLSVAYILATLKADKDTICAALLHDVIEDGDNITKEDIKDEFNKDIAILVDGVTKMKLELFPSKTAQNNANTRKIIMSMKKDPRIIIIKLIDRLHNMMTLEFLPRNKQIQNALETLEIFVPIAKHLGIHQIKTQLEELSFKYLNNDCYNFIEDQRTMYKQTKEPSLKELKEELTSKLNNDDINNNVNYRFKKNYSIYKGLTNIKDPRILINLELKDLINLLNINSNSIHDLQSLKIIVQNLEECYNSLEIIQNNYDIVPGKVKDCIMTPKTNGYQSLHTTILDKEYEKLQTQIRTIQMDKKDLLGIAEYWEEKNSRALYYMKQELYEKFPFFKNLIEIDKTISNDDDFIKQTKKEILSEMIYPHTKTGKIIELPIGSTIIDFACQESYDINNKIIAMVNGKIVPLNYVLKSKDNVELIQILKQQNLNNSCDVITTKAKQKLKKMYG